MSVQPNSFFIPQKNDIPLCTERIRHWYYNILLEIENANYPPEKLLLLKDKRNYYGKYLSEETREFFLNHFGRNLVETVNYFFGGKDNTRYLEVGSGCGNQLLLMAFLGAEVLGCDIRQDVCNLVGQRKGFYEKISGRKLNLSLLCEDVFNVDWDNRKRFDAMNFHFSFNDLKASEKMLELLNRLLKPGGRVVFQETNQSNYYNRLFRRRNSMMPLQIIEILKKYNFKTYSLKGGYAIPPVFWKFLPGSFLSPFDQFLCRSLFLSVSYHLMAEKY